jgi:excinuclease UvrABC nuclease subunit
MAFSQWWTFTDGMVNSDKDEPGVYEFADANGEIVYIGSSNQLKRRLKEHLGEGTTSCIKKCAKQYRLEYTAYYITRESELIATFKMAKGALPRCNSMQP